MIDVNTNVIDVGGARPRRIYLMSNVNTNVNDVHVGGARSGSIYLMSDVNTNVSDVGGKAWEHLLHERCQYQCQ